MILIGFYQAENSKSESLVNCTKDGLGRIDIPLTNYKVQCYDGTSNKKIHGKIKKNILKY